MQWGLVVVVDWGIPDQDRNTPVQFFLAGFRKVLRERILMIHKTNGTVYSVGSGGSGQLGTGNSQNQYNFTFISNVGSTVGLSAGSHQLLLGEVMAHFTGSNSNGQLGDGTTNNRFSSNFSFGVVRLNDMPAPLNNTPIIGSNGGGVSAMRMYRKPDCGDDGDCK